MTSHPVGAQVLVDHAKVRELARGLEECPEEIGRCRVGSVRQDHRREQRARERRVAGVRERKGSGAHLLGVVVGFGLPPRSVLARSGTS